MRIFKIPKGNKHHAVRCNGFQSTGEYRRYQDLLMLEKAKEIKDLKTQVWFTLQEKFVINGEKISSIRYVADFTYYDNRKKIIVIEDFKGQETDVFKVKKRMLLHQIKDNPKVIFLITTKDVLS